MRQKFDIDLENRHALSVDKFCKIIALLIFPKEVRKSVILRAKDIDIDEDGIVDQFDIETFLKRHNFIEKQ